MNYDLLNELLLLNYPSKRSDDGINWYKLSFDIDYSNTGVKFAILKKNLTVEMLERLADVLQVPVTTFFNEALAQQIIKSNAVEAANNSNLLREIGNNIKYMQSIIDQNKPRH